MRACVTRSHVFGFFASAWRTETAGSNRGGGLRPRAREQVIGCEIDSRCACGRRTDRRDCDKLTCPRCVGRASCSIEPHPAVSSDPRRRGWHLPRAASRIPRRHTRAPTLYVHQCNYAAAQPRRTSRNVHTPHAEAAPRAPTRAPRPPRGTPRACRPRPCAAPSGPQTRGGRGARVGAGPRRGVCVRCGLYGVVAVRHNCIGVHRACVRGCAAAGCGMRREVDAIPGVVGPNSRRGGALLNSSHGRHSVDK
jgi:hypothetical protein